MRVEMKSARPGISVGTLPSPTGGEDGGLEVILMGGSMILA
jgi:hypothetical protein